MKLEKADIAVFAILLLALILFAGILILTDPPHNQNDKVIEYEGQ